MVAPASVSSLRTTMWNLTILPRLSTTQAELVSSWMGELAAAAASADCWTSANIWLRPAASPALLRLAIDHSRPKATSTTRAVIPIIAPALPRPAFSSIVHALNLELVRGVASPS